MRQCPGIYFADEPSGRTAKIGRTGLGVWEVEPERIYIIAVMHLHRRPGYGRSRF
jgi:hypothetical protein